MFTRAPFMIEVVALAMILLGPLTAFGALKAKRGRWLIHKRIMSSVGIILLIAVILFEVQIRSFGWREAAKVSPYYDSLVFPSLWIHLPIAIVTSLTWILTVREAITTFALQAKPHGAKSAKHKLFGKIAVIGTLLTSLTGWVFFYLAFIANK